MLATGEIYHVFNKSIAEFKIFSYEKDILRIKQTLLYYLLSKTPTQLAIFLNSPKVKNMGFINTLKELEEKNTKQAQIIAYCIMPTHFHLILKQLRNDGIVKFMGNVLNSYARYYNAKIDRKGPLWVGPFKNVRVETDEQLLHLTRYIHLNPVTAAIVDSPEQWEASSYGEYTSNGGEMPICDYIGFFNMEAEQYRKFVDDGKDYQRALAKIKKLVLE